MWTSLVNKADFIKCIKVGTSEIKPCTTAKEGSIIAIKYPKDINEPTYAGDLKQIEQSAQYNKKTIQIDTLNSR